MEERDTDEWKWVYLLGVNFSSTYLFGTVGTYSTFPSFCSPSKVATCFTVY